MSDILEFILDLKSHMGDVLRKERDIAHTVFTGVDKDIAGTQKGLNDLGGRVRIDVDHSSLREASAQIDQVNEKMSLLQTTGAMAIGSFASQGAMMAIGKVRQAVESVWDNGVELQNMKVGLETFVGKDKANDIVKQVQQESVYTPFTTQTLEPIEQGFISTGMNEARANKDMMNLANAVAAVGGNSTTLDRIGADMMGAASRGTISGKEIMELQRTGHINIGSLIAKDKFPTMSLDKGLKHVEDMDIKFSDFESALGRAANKGGMFAGAMERLSQTVGGKGSTIKDQWWNMTADLLEKESGPIKNLEDEIIKGIAALPAVLDKMAPSIEALVKDFGELVKWVSTNTDTISTWFGLIKVGVEAYALWKISTVALTAANWLWVGSTAAQTVATTETAAATAAATAAIDLETEAIIVQQASVRELGLAWANMGLEQRAAYMAGVSQIGVGLPINMAGVAGAASGTATAAGLGLGGLIANGALVVGIAWMAGSVGEQMGLWHVKSMKEAGINFFIPDAIGVEMDTEYGRELQNKARLDRALYATRNGWGEFGIAHNMVVAKDHVDWAALRKDNAFAKMAIHDQGKDKTATPATSEASESIVGGGRKVVNINFRNFAEHFDIHASGADEGLKEARTKMEEWFFRMLKSIPS